MYRISTLNVRFCPKKPRKAPDLVEVPDDIQFDNYEQWPIHQSKRPPRSYKKGKLGGHVKKMQKMIIVDKKNKLLQ